MERWGKNSIVEIPSAPEKKLFQELNSHQHKKEKKYRKSKIIEARISYM